MSAPFTTAADARAFTLAGNARLTLVSGKTYTRFTYRVREIPDSDGQKFFVSVLTRPDNENGYSYIGLLLNDGSFRTTRKTKISHDSASITAFTWFANHVLINGKLPQGLEIWHEGRCGRCCRALTVPASIASGIGPECATKLQCQ